MMEFVKDEKMKNKIIFIFISVIVIGMLSACNLPSAKLAATDSIEVANVDAVATAVQLTLESSGEEYLSEENTPTDDVSVDEATATQELPTETPELQATVTETPTLNPTQTFTPTPTESMEDPAVNLGNASWTAEFSSDEEGFYDGDDEHTVIEVQNNALSMTSTRVIPGWHTWSMNYRTIKNAYIEAEIDVYQCSGTDEYGLVFRGPDYSSGYFFAARCNGEYSLRTYKEGEYEFVAAWHYSDRLNSGSNQANRLGVKMAGNEIKLYLNGELVDTITDDTFTGSGHFGFFIAAYETPGFRVEIDRARYWELN